METRMRRLLPIQTIVAAIVLCFSATQALAQIKIIKFYTISDSRKTAKQIRKKLKVYPDNPSLLNDLGLELLYQRKFDDAANSFESAIKNEPSNPGYISNLLFTLTSQKSIEKLEKNVAKLIEKEPDNPTGYLRRAMISAIENRIDDGLSDIETVLAKKPDSALAHALKSNFYLKKYVKSRTPTQSHGDLELLRRSTSILREYLSDDSTGSVHLKKAIADRTRTLSLLDDATMQSSSAKPDVRLKIISKPKPSYMGIPLVLKVTGTVQLLVVFNADSTIGPVVVVKGRPAGLTESAVNAAQKIQFEAEISHGKYVTVVRKLTYNFVYY